MNVSKYIYIYLQNSESCTVDFLVFSSYDEYYSTLLKWEIKTVLET